jgi:long-chain acyl-CoA synthetase
MTLGTRLHATAARSPHKTAVCCGDQRISYEDLDLATTVLAGWLISQGLRPGDRVAIHWPNTVEAVQLFFAVFKAGLIAVPVNSRLKAPEIEFVLRHSGARLCFSHPSVVAATEQAAARTTKCTVRTTIPADNTSNAVLPLMDASQAATILYTSGTTARPRGAVHTHATMLATTEVVRSALEFLEDDVLLVALPLMHAAALIGVLIPSVILGATAALIPVFEAGAVLDAIERFRCTQLPMMPALLQFVVAEQARKRRDVSSLRGVFVGGDTASFALQYLVREHFRLDLQEVYGMSESVPLTINPKQAHRPGSIGVALGELRIVDPLDHDVAPGGTGEIIARSPINCIGYWDDPAATAHLLRGGWLHTGDLAERDSDGYYWFRGRIKQIIVRGGSNISPQEVEEALYQHSAVLEAGVVGKPDETYGETVVAFVSLRPGAVADEAELREFVRRRLADYKTPENIFILAELPKGPTGKVFRRALKERLIAQAQTPGNCDSFSEAAAPDSVR